MSTIGNTISRIEKSIGTNDKTQPPAAFLIFLNVRYISINYISIWILDGLTKYLYFKSKEDLFHEIYSMIDNRKETQKLKLLAGLPLSARQKIHKLSEFLIDRLESDESFAAMIALNTQAMLEKNDFACEDFFDQSDWYQYTANIIKQGQKEKSVVTGSPMKLADYYWGVVYLYSLKKLFTAKYEIITAHDLERILLKDYEK